MRYCVTQRTSGTNTTLSDVVLAFHPCVRRELMHDMLMAKEHPRLCEWSQTSDHCSLQKRIVPDLVTWAGVGDVTNASAARWGGFAVCYRNVGTVDLRACGAVIGTPNWAVAPFLNTHCLAAPALWFALALRSTYVRTRTARPLPPRAASRSLDSGRGEAPTSAL